MASHGEVPDGLRDQLIEAAADALVRKRMLGRIGDNDVARAVDAVLPLVAALQAEAEQRHQQDLTEAETVLLDLSKRLLAVKTSLDRPYEDEPDWSPWTRFVEQPCRVAYNLGSRLRRARLAREAAGGPQS